MLGMLESRHALQRAFPLHDVVLHVFPERVGTHFYRWAQTWLWSILDKTTSLAPIPCTNLVYSEHMGDLSGTIQFHWLESMMRKKKMQLRIL